MKKLTALLVFFVLLAVMTAGVAADQIRVGLTGRINESARVTVNSNVIAIGFEADGVYAERAVVFGYGLAFAPSRGFYVRVNQYFYAFETARMAAAAFAENSPPVPCYIGFGRWALQFGSFDTYEQAAAFAASIENTSIISGSRRIALSDANGVIALFDSPYGFPQISVPGEETFFIDGGRGLGRYRGRVELGRFAGNNITGVNVLCIEQYLYSVVPAEMPPSWHPEALKAQAVAARTFAHYRIRMQRHAVQGFDLCDAECCQVYVGANNENERTTAAVRATNGLVMRYNGLPIFAAFSASSGGHTDNSENVWVTALPYLRGVPDPFDTTAEWTREFTYQELTALAAANNHTIGNVTGVSVSFNQNNRAQELILHGTIGTATIRSEAIRTFFRTTPGGSLRSRNFVLETSTAQPPPIQQPPLQTANVLVRDAYGLSVLPPRQTAISASGVITEIPTDAPIAVIGAGGVLSVIDLSGAAESSNQNPAPNQNQGSEPVPHGTIRITGRGHGHGVGLSQHGANGKANAGYTFMQILQWYYTGVDIR